MDVTININTIVAVAVAVAVVAPHTDHAIKTKDETIGKMESYAFAERGSECKAD